MKTCKRNIVKSILFAIAIALSSLSCNQEIYLEQGIVQEVSNEHTMLKSALEGNYYYSDKGEKESVMS